MNIFPDMKSPQEALIHPYISEILSGLRKKTDECFRISTNGSALTPETINMLAENRPVYLDISLNSSSPDRRAWLMGDKNPETVLNSFDLLEKAGIPYSVVIVPWPFPAKETMINDLKQTIEFTYSKNPTLIQISLPGYTKNISDKFWFSTEDVWSAIKINVQSLRSRTGSPIALRPGLYEEYADVDKLNQPVLLGSVRNSPISNAGILPGDYILKINGIPVKSRCQARSLLTVLHQSDLKKSSLTVIRNKKQLDIEFDLLNFGYPYAKESATHLGAVFASSGIPEIWIENLKQTIDEYNAENVLLLTSTLVKPLLEKLIAKNGWFSSINLNLHTPENNYFNGNIFMGDLLTVEDFVFAVNKFMERNIRPDLVVLPSSPFYLSGCGRDLTGRVYLDIERSLNIPVALVECDPIFD